MSVALRTPYIAYVLRAGLVEEMLDSEATFNLLRAANHHGRELADERNYSADHNHGLFQDEGLYLLARQLPTLPAASAWAALAIDRLRRTLQSTICAVEGGHLEHSSSYQFAISSMVSRLVDTMREVPGLDDLLKRLKQAAAWHVMPTGRVAQLGDSDDEPAEKWAIEAASAQRGLGAFPLTGYAFVRDGDSYLAVTSGYHSSAHKQADDTGLLLVEGGQVVLGDAGRWGYYEGEPDRCYARSAFAHNVMTVDEQDFDWRACEPYGSGLLAIHEEDGWYAILVRNPLLSRQGVEHHRLLLYRPAETLIIIDKVRSAVDHDYARRFHFGPELDASWNGSRHIEITGNSLVLTFTDLGESPKLDLKRGGDEPKRLGWSYPGDRKRVAIWTATTRTRTASATLASLLTIRRTS